MLHQTFNDFILSAMLLHLWHHGSITIATTKLSNVLQSPLAECGSEVTSLRQCDVIVDMIILFMK